MKRGRFIIQEVEEEISNQKTEKIKHIKHSSFTRKGNLVHKTFDIQHNIYFNTFVKLNTSSSWVNFESLWGSCLKCDDSHIGQSINGLFNYYTSQSEDDFRMIVEDHSEEEDKNTKLNYNTTNIEMNTSKLALVLPQFKRSNKSAQMRTRRSVLVSKTMIKNTSTFLKELEEFRSKRTKSEERKNEANFIKKSLKKKPIKIDTKITENFLEISTLKRKMFSEKKRKKFRIFNPKKFSVDSDYFLKADLKKEKGKTFTITNEYDKIVQNKSIYLSIEKETAFSISSTKREINHTCNCPYR
jgi:hypothetical protein